MVKSEKLVGNMAATGQSGVCGKRQNAGKRCAAQAEQSSSMTEDEELLPPHESLLLQAKLGKLPTGILSGLQTRIVSDLKEITECMTETRKWIICVNVQFF